MHPILFEIGPVAVGSYGVAVLAGLGAGWLVLPRYARRAGIDPAAARRMFFLVFVAGWFGCRLAGVVVDFPAIAADPARLLRLPQIAGVWYGALVSGGIAAALLARRFGMSYAAALDAAAIPVLIGGGIGRFGCLLSGCCHGTPTDLPWAVTYTDPVAHRMHPDLPWIPLHPAVMYEAAAAFAIAVVLDRLGRRSRPAGTIGLCWIALYGAVRIVVEHFRGDAIRGTVGWGVSTSQAISGIAVAAAVAVLARRARPKPGAGDVAVDVP